MSQIYEEAPMPGMQLTIALTALGTTGVLLGSFAANQGTQLERQLKKIARWVDECSEQTKKERFSRGGARAVESAAGAFQSWMKEQKRDMAWEWVCLAWVSLFWVWDARRGCPIYGQGAKKLAWRYLDITLHTLARAITEPGDDTAELAWPGYALMSDIIYGGKQ